jgi:hypothetical protein
MGLLFARQGDLRQPCRFDDNVAVAGIDGVPVCESCFTAWRSGYVAELDLALRMRTRQPRPRSDGALMEGAP